MKPATTAGKTPAEHLRPRDLSRSGLLSYLDSPDRRCHSPCNESMTEKNPVAPSEERRDSYQNIWFHLMALLLVPRNEVAEAFHLYTDVASACSFHRCSFTPFTRSHTISDKAPKRPKAAM
jgi:hypothetical protein